MPASGCTGLQHTCALSKVQPFDALQPAGLMGNMRCKGTRVQTMNATQHSCFSWLHNTVPSDGPSLAACIHSPSHVTHTNLAPDQLFVFPFTPCRQQTRGHMLLICRVCFHLQSTPLQSQRWTSGVWLVEQHPTAHPLLEQHPCQPHVHA